MAQVVLCQSPMTPQELRDRSKQFASRARQFCAPLLHRRELGEGPDQLMRASASAAGNYRAACSAYTRPLFLAKMAQVQEESDEALYWAEYLQDAGMKSPELDWLISEARELAKIFCASLRTARARTPRRAPRARRRSRNDQ